jgi:flagellum-specific peptidoglycan hydrolase FlgJ
MEQKESVGRGLIAVALIAVVLTGCGSDSSSSGGQNATSASTASSKQETKEKQEGAEWSEPLLNSKSKSKVSAFGEEADEDEREAASAVLEENLVAREAGEWAKQCSSLTERAIKKLKENPVPFTEGGKGCAKELESQAEPLTQSRQIRKNTMTGPIDLLRISGNQAFAVYAGTGGKTYAMPMEKVDDEWKVDHLIITELK